MSNSTDIVSNTLVLGVGNTLLSDEGVGVRTVEYMRRSYPNVDTEYLDGGTLSFNLAQYIEDADQLVVVDAGNIHGRPGEWKCFIDRNMDQFLARPGRSVHEVSLGDLLDVCRLRERLPQPRALYVIQPHNIDWGDELTPAVAQAVADAAASIRRLIQGWRQQAALLPPSR